MAAVECEPGKLNGDLSPKFTQTLNTDRAMGDKVLDEEDAASISLTQYYLKSSVQERKAAQNDKEDFLKTLNQMEQEDVPAEYIEEYRKAEILRKSMAVVKKHAQRMDEIRTSPERYDRVKGKVSTKNPFAANLSSMQGTKRSMMMNTTGGTSMGGIKLYS